MIIVQKRNLIKPEFSQIPLNLIENPHLSWKAKGVYCYLWSRPDAWNLNMTDLINRSTEGETAVRSALRELSRTGYYKVIPRRNDKGQMDGKTMLLFDKPSSKKSTEPVENQSSGNPRSGQSATNYINKHITRLNCGGKGSLRSPTFPSTNGFLNLNGNVSPFIEKVITRLENYVRQEWKLTNRRINRHKWAEQIRLLLQDIGGDKKRLKQVLMGYISSPNDKFKPQAECAAALRRKFVQIENWVNKNAPPPPPEEIEVEIVRRRKMK